MTYYKRRKFFQAKDDYNNGIITKKEYEELKKKYL